jgi:hypothetical protein
VAVDGTLDQPLDRGHLPSPTDQIRLSKPGSTMPLAHAQQSTGGYRRIGTLDLDQLRSESQRHQPVAPTTR